MRKLLWMLGGVLFVSLAFFIPGGAEHIWESLLYSYLAIALFLVIFIIVQARKSDKSSKFVACVMAILMLPMGIYGWIGFRESQNQESNLAYIRETIEVEIAKNYINKMLLGTLRGYYSSDNGLQSFGKIFHARYDSLISRTQINYDPQHPDESLKIELAKASADSLVLIAYSTFAPGRCTDFENYSGSKGRIQTKGILTVKGIEYEREN